MPSPGINAFTGWLDVTDYGALGTGNGDDGIAFQAAIAAAPALGALILVPTGTYKIVTSPTFGSKTNVKFFLMPGVTFTGSGAMPAASGSNGYFTAPVDKDGNPATFNPVIGAGTPTVAGTLGYSGGELNVGDGTISRPLGMYKIGEVVSAASQATIPIAAIGQGYRHLRVEGLVTTSVLVGAISLQANGDTGFHYTFALSTFGSGAALTGTTTANQAFLPIGGMQGSPRLHSFVIDIPLYSVAKTVQPFIAVTNQSDIAGAAPGITTLAGTWTTAAPITSLLFFLGGGNFVDGSIVTWYGIP